ncbi:hypothetical protein [Amycolatopsis vancoresmycina]|uniref:Uncharacterized protein n=1 Tax=Amycolatopsis vancoresmycina DSM 44592 TaxID=1292037 RepID=R1HRU6_9PSEU|nr:hypothetical protein [Amycolatopsis vancoresmycina]EOD66300.1 hypothetical protein H480_22187 [Amycolatopsis vancoresmycina DSM 44592]
MRRITATIGALVLTTGVLFGAEGVASAQSEPVPVPLRCVGSSLAMFATNALCVVPRTYPILLIPAS